MTGSKLLTILGALSAILGALHATPFASVEVNAAIMFAGLIVASLTEALHQEGTKTFTVLGILGVIVGAGMAYTGFVPPSLAWLPKAFEVGGAALTALGAPIFRPGGTTPSPLLFLPLALVLSACPKPASASPPLQAFQPAVAVAGDSLRIQIPGCDVVAPADTLYTVGCHVEARINGGSPMTWDLPLHQAIDTMFASALTPLSTLTLAVQQWSKNRSGTLGAPVSGSDSTVVADGTPAPLKAFGPTITVIHHQVP